MAAGARECSFAALTLHTLVGAQRAKHLDLDYDSDVYQSAQTNPHRNA
jgi:hypothetical protein